MSYLRQLCFISVLVQTALSVPHGSFFRGRYANVWMSGGWVEYSIYFRTRDGVDYMDISYHSYVPQLEAVGGPGQFALIMNGIRYTEHSFARYHGISPDWDSASAENLAIRRRMALELQLIFYFIDASIRTHRFPDPETFLDTIVYDPENPSLIIGQTEPPPGPPFIMHHDSVQLWLSTVALAPIVCAAFKS